MKQETETVYVTMQRYDKKIYHTDKNCVNLPDHHKPKQRHLIDPTYRECKLCANSDGSAMSYVKGDTEDKEPCPICGEPVKRLPPHLPCDDD